MVELREHVVALVGDGTLRAGLADAAFLLLAGAFHGQRVDRLARLTGLSPSFVAKAARRLVDNGVWNEGETLCTWSFPLDEAEAFASDAAVAAGQACRRCGEDGTPEWAPAGLWWKGCDLLPTAGNASLAIQYRMGVRPEDLPEATWPYDDGDGETEETGVLSPAPAMTKTDSFGSWDWSPTATPAPEVGGVFEHLPSVSSPEGDLFPGASWLS